MADDAGKIVVPPQVRVVTAKLAAAPPEPPQNVLEAPRWIALAEKHVHEDADHVASVDPRIDDDPDLKGQPALVVRQCVAAYNALPADLRRMKDRPSPMTPTPRTDLTAMAACVAYAHPAYYWWGSVTYLNDCLVNDIVFGLAGSAAIAGAIAAACPPCSVVAGVIAGFLALYAAWLQWADQHCGNRGAYVNATWVGYVWISTVC